jgi:hypothetical protein
MKNFLTLCAALLISRAVVAQGSTQCPTLSSAPAFVLCQYPTVTLTALLSSATTSVSFTWVAPPGATVSGGNTKNLIANTVGVYTVTAYNSVLNCSATMQYSISGCVGINELGTDPRFTVLVFPNPCAGTCFITTNTPLKASLYTADGQLVLLRQYEEGAHAADLQTLSAGLYFLKLEIKDYTQTLRIFKTE